MIRFICGTYLQDTDNGIVIETDMGLGFQVTVPTGSPVYKNSPGDRIKVFTEMVVRENDVSLYGFHNMETLEVFNLLTTVSGVGPKAAVSVLGAMSTEDLKKAISTGDAKFISQANGIGKKTAERIVLELKEKIGADTDSRKIVLNPDVYKDERTEAVSALVALGYSKTEAYNAVSKIQEDGLGSQDYIKRALKNLM
ncbi:MAG: Holliday junction branch migration protein RuvA [Clostridia bacterium]|nr:Holliday junction branch migration protein RuvA [Clostridia bacterium]